MTLNSGLSGPGGKVLLGTEISSRVDSGYTNNIDRQRHMKKYVWTLAFWTFACVNSEDRDVLYKDEYKVSRLEGEVSTYVKGASTKRNI